MTKEQFIIRMILNIIIGIMFIYAMRKMASRNNAEKPKRPWITKCISVVFILLGIFYGILCVVGLSNIYFPVHSLEPPLGKYPIFRSPDIPLLLGAPTPQQQIILSTELSVMVFLGLAVYFFFFRWSNSKWWGKIVKFLSGVLLYAFMASASNLTYLDFWSFMPLILFIVLWYFIIRNCNKNNNEEENTDKIEIETSPAQNVQEGSAEYIDKKEDLKQNILTPLEENSSNVSSITNDKEALLSQETENSKIKTEKEENKKQDKHDKITFKKRLSKIWHNIVNGFSKTITWIKRKWKLLCIIIGVIVLIITAIICIIKYYREVYIPNKEKEQYNRMINSIKDKLSSRDDKLRYEYSVIMIDSTVKINWNDSDYQECLQIAHKNMAHRADSMCRIASKFRSDTDFDRAAYWYLQAAKYGNSCAQYEIGMAYKAGRGVKMNMKKAVYWIQKSAENGEGYGQLQLGDFYRDGVGLYREVYRYGAFRKEYCGQILEEDIKQAKYWWRKAALNKDTREEAMDRLEKIYD